DGIRDRTVTGVQTCALPISDEMALPCGAVVTETRCPGSQPGREPLRQHPEVIPAASATHRVRPTGPGGISAAGAERPRPAGQPRSEERRVGKEGRRRACEWR